MAVKIEVLLSPAEYQARAAQGFAGQVCVVFDVLRATSVMVTGLGNGAMSFLPVAEIEEAVAAQQKLPLALLAGEREGLRITAAQSGGREFEFGNSPREYSAARVAGRTIITTTTNGTRALRVCASAEAVVLGSFLNLATTTQWLVRRANHRLVLICAGTGNGVALEDVLGAGAMCDQIARVAGGVDLEDAALLARELYRAAAADLLMAVSATKNGRRLAAHPDLRDDIQFCLQRDIFNLVGVLGADGMVRVVNP